MTISLRDAANSIDRLNPPESMRDLARRFRYTDVEPGLLPSGTISLQALGLRVDTAIVKKLEFLHYNTWLMEDNLHRSLADIIKIVGSVPRFWACLGLSSTQLLAKVLEKIGIGSSQICDKLFPIKFSICGVLNTVPNVTCRGIVAAGDLADKVIEEYGDALDFIFDLLGLKLNFLVDVVAELLSELYGLFLPDLFHPAQKPYIDSRAIEIGDEVFKYDFVSLCEVWQQKHKNLLLSRGSSVVTYTGPSDPVPGEWQHLGSGLLVFSPTFTTQDGGVHKYKTTGVTRSCDLGYAVDADKWSCKGIQRTLIDVGLGYIEVYSTHLYSGGDMLTDKWGAGIFGGEPTKQEKIEIRLAQVEELAQFIAKTHAPGNVAIIAGDFNIQGYPNIPEISHARPKMLDRLRSINGCIFDDWYSLPTFSFPNYDNKGGDTVRWGGEENPEFKYCKKAPSPISPVGSNGDYYCVDNYNLIKPSEDASDTDARIDYIFVQRPVSSHTFTLDVSRIRRRAFKRSEENAKIVEDGKPQYFMSDHLGLEVTLFVSPR